MPHFKFLLMLLCVSFNVTAQFALKRSTMGNARSLRLLFLEINLYTLAGLIAYGLSFGLTIVVYKHFRLSTIAPVMTAMTLLMIAPLDRIIFGTPVGIMKSAGLILLVAGVLLIAFDKSA